MENLKLAFVSYQYGTIKRKYLDNNINIKQVHKKNMVKIYNKKGSSYKQEERRWTPSGDSSW